MAAGANLMWHFAQSKAKTRLIDFEKSQMYVNVSESERKSLATLIQIQSFKLAFKTSFSVVLLRTNLNFVVAVPTNGQIG